MKFKLPTNIFVVLLIVFINCSIVSGQSILSLSPFPDAAGIFNRDSGSSLHENLTTLNLIKRNGYPSESYKVRTEDGYILELHRVPYGLKSPEGPGKIPVIIQHGNFQSSADWMLNDADNALPLILADNGYDVWLGNQRGNTYSNKHEKYAFEAPEFWNYSYHDAALHDVPAMIDFVLETNGNGYKKLNYVCHSVGCKNFVAGISLRPEYNDKVTIGVLMGPAGYMGHMFNGYARLLSPLLMLGQIALNIFGNRPATPHRITQLERMFRPMVCRRNIDVIGVCEAFFYSAYGLDREQITAEKIQEIKVIFPSTSSFKLWMHLVQEIQSGHFRQYDYGHRNMEVYGRPTPPDYELSNVKVPISIIHGEKDHIARIEDTEALAKGLPNVVDFYVVPWKNWTHVDFNYAKDAGALNHKHIVEMLEKYKSEFNTNAPANEDLQSLPEETPS